MSSSNLGSCRTARLGGKISKAKREGDRSSPKVIVATLDREIKKKTENQKLIIRGKKKLEIL